MSATTNVTYQWDEAEAETDEPTFVPHECIECGNDVPGSPDDCEVMCARCGRDSAYL